MSSSRNGLWENLLDEQELAKRTHMMAERHERFLYMTQYLKEAEKPVEEMGEAGAQDGEQVKDKDLEISKAMRKRDTVQAGH